MIETINQGLQNDGFTVSTSKICQWFGVPRRTVYYKPAKSAPKVQECFVGPIKAKPSEAVLLRRCLAKREKPNL